MNNIQLNINKECAKFQSLSTDYMDDALSAREVIDVEKHLNSCSMCASLFHQSRELTELLHAAPRLDTSKDFMNSLHGRLDNLDPQATSRRSTLSVLQDWLADFNITFNQLRAPAAGMGFAVVLLTILFFAQSNIRPGVKHNSQRPSSETMHSIVSSAANNPFADPAAENLEGRLAQSSGALSANEDDDPSI